MVGGEEERRISCEASHDVVLMSVEVSGNPGVHSHHPMVLTPLILVLRPNQIPVQNRLKGVIIHMCVLCLSLACWRRPMITSKFRERDQHPPAS